MLKEKQLLGQKILFVTAHPDDESFAAAGTIYKNYQAGGKSFLLCATLGEKGKSHLKEDVSESKLKKIRRQELKSATKFLKISKVFILNLPDCGLNQKANQKILEQKIAALAKTLRPDRVISFGKDGISGHLDHISIGKVSRRIAGKLKIPFLAFCCPPQLKRTLTYLTTRRKHGRYTRKMEFEKYNLKIKVDSKIKLRALKIHRSQIENDEPFFKLPRIAARAMLENEYFKNFSTG